MKDFSTHHKIKSSIIIINLNHHRSSYHRPCHRVTSRGFPRSRSFSGLDQSCEFEFQNGNNNDEGQPPRLDDLSTAGESIRAIDAQVLDTVRVGIKKSRT
jgi:hypothetical protein